MSQAPAEVAAGRPQGDASPSRQRTVRLTARQRRALRRATARRSVRIIRRVDLWSVLRFSLVAYTCAYVAFLVAGTVLWLIADARGLIANLESFIAQLLEFESFELRAGIILRAAILLGLIGVVGGTVLTVLAAGIFNLISDVVGGVRVVVAEEPPPPGER